MGLIWLIIVGAVAGYLATRLMDIQASPLVTVGIGIAGAIVGGLILHGALAFMGMLGGIFGAVLGAVVVIWIYQAVSRKK